MLQFGSFATLKNSIVFGFADAAFDLRLPAAVLASELGPGKSIDISHVLMHANASPYTTGSFWSRRMASMRLADPGLADALDAHRAVVLAADDDVLIEPQAGMPPFDTTATYRGAMPPDGPDWTSGWTAFPER